MIENFQGRYRIDSIRLSKWNYGWNASYFVTICTEGKELFFGHIDRLQFVANSLGDIALQCWQEMPRHYPFVQLDEFVVMPNHVHGIVRIKHGENRIDAGCCRDLHKCRDAINRVSTLKPAATFTNYPTASDINSPPHKQHGGITGHHNPMLHENLSRVIRWYKGRITYVCRKMNPNFGWQERFHEHIIRNEETYQTIKKYIINNSANWENDKFYNIDTV